MSLRIWSRELGRLIWTRLEYWKYHGLWTPHGFGKPRVLEVSLSRNQSFSAAPARYRDYFSRRGIWSRKMDLVFSLQGNSSTVRTGDKPPPAFYRPHVRIQSKFVGEAMAMVPDRGCREAVNTGHGSRVWGSGGRQRVRTFDLQGTVPDFQKRRLQLYLSHRWNFNLCHRLNLIMVLRIASYLALLSQFIFSSFWGTNDFGTRVLQKSQYGRYIAIY